MSDSASPAVSPLPAFTYRGVALAPATLAYNPCGDVIFPSVIRTDHLSAPRGRYAMYYSPHNAPGGVCLAWADDPRGPWREHPNNPLIVRAWPPHYAVSHIASPHALWIPEERRLFLYYHGENDTTRYATSTDGVAFTYGGVAVTAAQVPGQIGASYARVFPAPSTAPGRYLMTFMGAEELRNDIFLAWSDDARHWRAEPQPFISPPAAQGYAYVCAAWYERVGDRHFLIFHADFADPVTHEVTMTDLLVAETDGAFREARVLGPCFPHTAVGRGNARASDACVLRTDDTWYLFFTQGTRLAQSVALAEAPAP